MQSNKPRQSEVERMAQRVNDRMTIGGVLAIVMISGVVIFFVATFVASLFM